MSYAYYYGDIFDHGKLTPVMYTLAFVAITFVVTVIGVCCYGCAMLLKRHQDPGRARLLGIPPDFRTVDIPEPGVPLLYVRPPPVNPSYTGTMTPHQPRRRFSATEKQQLPPPKDSAPPAYSEVVSSSSPFRRRNEDSESSHSQTPPPPSYSHFVDQDPCEPSAPYPSLPRPL